MAFFDPMHRNKPNITYLPTYLSTYLLTYLLTYLFTTYLLTYLFIYLLNIYLLFIVYHLFTCLLTYLFTYLLTYLYIYLLTYYYLLLLTCLLTYLLLTYLLGIWLLIHAGIKVKSYQWKMTLAYFALNSCRYCDTFVREFLWGKWWENNAITTRETIIWFRVWIRYWIYRKHTISRPNELWCVFYENLGGNKSRYKCTALYFHFSCKSDAATISCGIKI